MRLKYIDVQADYERLYDFSGQNCGQNSYFVDAYVPGRRSRM